MERWPRIVSVVAVGDTHLRVCFDNGAIKLYDCRPVIARPQFQLLAVPAFFRAVRVDTGGCGVSWNDDMDLSEYELWVNGEAALPDEMEDAHPRSEPDPPGGARMMPIRDPSPSRHEALP